MEGIDTKTATTIESGSKVSGFDGVEMNVKQSKVRKQYRDVYSEGILRYVCNSAWLIHFGEKGERPYLNVLLICVPLAIICDAAGASKAATFVFSLLGICPLAERLGYVTEDVAKYTNSTLGGLLNATFGNATELIVSLIALGSDKTWIVKASLLGSVLSNLLLVLGCAFLVGGIKVMKQGRKEQKFNITAATTNGALLLLATMGMIFPALLSSTGGERTEDAALDMSRAVSMGLLLGYAAYLYFQLKTHTSVFEDDEEDDDEEPQLGLWGGIVWLAVITTFIGLLSDYLVDTLEDTASDIGIPAMFIATIIVPIVGNAAEHAAAVVFAYKNKMAISIGIAVGSATQISLFLVPAMVLAGWMGDVKMSLDFHPYETGAMLISVLVGSFIIQDGSSNWLKGVMLILGYYICCCGFWTLCDPPDIEGAKCLATSSSSSSST
eukprot:g4344.t1